MFYFRLRRITRIKSEWTFKIKWPVKKYLFKSTDVFQDSYAHNDVLIMSIYDLWTFQLFYTFKKYNENKVKWNLKSIKLILPILWTLLLSRHSIIDEFQTVQHLYNVRNDT